MNEKIEIVKIEAQGFQDLCKYLAELEEKNKILETENKQLKADNRILGDELTYFKEYSADLETELNTKSRMLRGVKLNNGKLTLERNELIKELDSIKRMSMFEFGNTYCSNESLEADGHAFARSLLGHRMTDEEIAIDEAENAYVPYSGDDF